MKFILLSLTVPAAAAVAVNRFVGLDGNYPAAGGKAIGVAACDGIAGDLLPVDVQGIGNATAGAAFAKDVPLMVTATGKVVAHDAATGSIAVARSLEASTGDGQLVEILLVPNVGAADAD
jgi:hypothetical protein